MAYRNRPISLPNGIQARRRMALAGALSPRTAYGCAWKLAGQSVGLVQEMKPAAEVVKEFLDGAHHILSSLTAAAER
jgi:hypothetical protein